MAVHSSHRGKDIGRALHAHAESWLIKQGAEFLQVKTMAASHSSPHYAETRLFYEQMGYLPIEVFPEFWAAHLPALQLIKRVQSSSREH